MIARRGRAARRARGAGARALGLADRVVFAGFRRDLDRLLPAFSVFCLSSRLEGLGHEPARRDGVRPARRGHAPRAGSPRPCADGVTGRAGAAARPRRARRGARRGPRATRRVGGPGAPPAAGASSSASRPTAWSTRRCASLGRSREGPRDPEPAGRRLAATRRARAAERGHPALERLRPLPSPRGPATRPSSRAAAAAAGAELVLVGRAATARPTRSRAG